MVGRRRRGKRWRRETLTRETLVMKGPSGTVKQKPSKKILCTPLFGWLYLNHTKSRRTFWRSVKERKINLHCHNTDRSQIRIQLTCPNEPTMTLFYSKVDGSSLDMTYSPLSQFKCRSSISTLNIGESLSKYRVVIVFGYHWKKKTESSLSDNSHISFYLKSTL